MPRHHAHITISPVPGKRICTKSDRELALFAVKAGRDQVDEIAASPNIRRHDENRRHEREQRAHDSRDAIGLLARLVGSLAREHAGIDGNKGRREHAVAEQVLQEVGNLQRGVKRVARIRAAEVVGEDLLPDESGDAREQDARGNQLRTACPRGLFLSGGCHGSRRGVCLPQPLAHQLNPTKAAFRAESARRPDSSGGRCRGRAGSRRSHTDRDGKIISSRSWQWPSTTKSKPWASFASA